MFIELGRTLRSATSNCALPSTHTLNWDPLDLDHLFTFAISKRHWWHSQTNNVEDKWKPLHTYVQSVSQQGRTLSCTLSCTLAQICWPQVKPEARLLQNLATGFNSWSSEAYFYSLSASQGSMRRDREGNPLIGSSFVTTRSPIDGL